MNLLRGLTGGRMEASRAFRLRFRIASVFLASAAGYAFSVLIQESLYYWALLPGVGLIAAALLEFVIAEVIVDARFPPETEELLSRLKRALTRQSTDVEIRRILDRCVDTFQGCKPHSVSAAAHLCIEVIGEKGPEYRLLQVTDYTEKELGGSKWRITNSRLGIIGRCLRTGETEFVNFIDSADYEQRMVSEFGFTRKQANSHTTSARSYLAHPVVVDWQVVAVLYFFSTEPQVFPLAADLHPVNEAGHDIVGLLRVAEVIA